MTEVLRFAVLRCSAFEFRGLRLLAFRHQCAHNLQFIRGLTNHVDVQVYFMEASGTAHLSHPPCDYLELSWSPLPLSLAGITKKKGSVARLDLRAEERQPPILQA